MARAEIGWLQHGEDYSSVFIILIILQATLTSGLAPGQSQSPILSPIWVHAQDPQLARVFSAYPYDEQVGTTFTQDIPSLAFNVTAVAQTGPDGVGPGYLLNGLTNRGYWYQVGISWNWPHTSGGVNPGFSMNYEVFSPNGVSIFPSSGGGGLQSITVNQGDIVLLNLHFSGGYVAMSAKDWNTGSSASQTFSAEGATYFVGLRNSDSQNGFFTGLMTEQYHSSPYYGTGQPVAYTATGLTLGSAWMWMDEFNTVTDTVVFSDATHHPIVFSNSTPAHYFSSNGTAEAADTHSLVTGLAPVRPLFLNSISLATAHPGELASVTIDVENPSLVRAKITGLSILTNFGNYTPSSGIPVTLNTRKATFTTTIILPATVPTGNHTLTIVATWQFYVSQIQNWIVPVSIKADAVLSITSVPSQPPSQPNTPVNGNPAPALPNPLLAIWRSIWLPAGLTYAAFALLAIAMVVRRRWKHVLNGSLSRGLACQRCGKEVSPTMLFCPNCGSGLVASGVAEAPRA